MVGGCSGRGGGGRWGGATAKTVELVVHGNGNILTSFQVSGHCPQWRESFGGGGRVAWRLDRE